MTTAVLRAAGRSRSGWGWRYVILGGLSLIGMGLAPTAFVLYALLLVASAFLIAGLRRPASVVVAIAVVELTVGTYPSGLVVPGIATRYVVIGLSVGVAVLLLPILIHRQLPPVGLGRVLAPGIAFVILVGVSTANGLTPELLMQALRYYMAGLIAMCLVVALINSAEDAKFAGAAIIVGLTISGLAATIQHYNPMYGVPVPSLYDSVTWSGRSLGLSDSPVKLGNDLVIGASVLWGIVATLTVDHRWGRPLLIAFMISLLGLYFTYTRSATYGLVIGAAAVIPLVHRHVRKEAVLALVLLAPLVLLFLMKENSRYVMSVEKDDSASSRVVLWQIGLDIAMDNPLFGIGYDGWNDVAPSYAADLTLPDEIEDLGVRGSAEDFPVHNDFLRVWHSFGTPALVVYTLLLAGIAWNFFMAQRRAREPWLKGASVGGLAGLIGYTINSVFHNSLDMTIALWLIAGFSVVFLKLSTASASSFQDNRDVS